MNGKEMKKILFFLCSALALFTSCADDDKTVTTTYNMGFIEQSYDGTESGVVASETAAINRVFCEELLETSNTFTRISSLPSSDKAITDACKRAEQRLGASRVKGHYVFVVRNVTCATTLYTLRLN